MARFERVGIVFSPAMNNNTHVKLNSAHCRTLSLIKLFTIAANFKTATCIRCHTFALQIRLNHNCVHRPASY